MGGKGGGPHKFRARASTYLEKNLGAVPGLFLGFFRKMLPTTGHDDYEFPQYVLRHALREFIIIMAAH